MSRPFLTTLATLVALGAAPGSVVAADPSLVRMATGSINAVYFPVGVALCRVVNAERPVHGVRCSALPTEGSVDNVVRLQAGDVEVAIIQSDIQQAAFLGEDIFADTGPIGNLRSLLALHPEPLTVVSRRDADATSIADLRGKRISFGADGSGAGVLWDKMIKASGWAANDFVEVPDIASADLAEALCSGRIDAFVVAVGHPARSVQEATLGCDAALLPVEGPAVEALVAERNVYFESEIPGGLYTGNPDPVPSFGVGATLVTLAEVPDDVIEPLVTGILDALDDVRGFEAALVNLDALIMATTGRTAPLHPAAERVLAARGLLDEAGPLAGGG